MAGLYLWFIYSHYGSLLQFFIGSSWICAHFVPHTVPGLPSLALTLPLPAFTHTTLPWILVGLLASPFSSALYYLGLPCIPALPAPYPFGCWITTPHCLAACLCHPSLPAHIALTYLTLYGYPCPYTALVGLQLFLVPFRVHCIYCYLYLYFAVMPSLVRLLYHDHTCCACPCALILPFAIPITIPFAHILFYLPYIPYTIGSQVCWMGCNITPLFPFCTHLFILRLVMRFFTPFAPIPLRWPLFHYSGCCATLYCPPAHYTTTPLRFTFGSGCSLPGSAAYITPCYYPWFFPFCLGPCHTTPRCHPTR